MTPSRLLRIAPLVVLALGAGRPAGAESGYDPRRIGWSELLFEASKLGLKVESRLQMRPISATEMRAALVDPGPGDWLEPPPPGGWLVELASEGLGRRSRLELILDSRGTALQRTQIETGRRLKDHRRRTYRFAATAVHIGTVKPNRDEMRHPEIEWTQRTEWLQELPTEVRSGPGLGQATGLFYTLAAAELLEPGDRVTTLVLSKGKVMEVELLVESREQIEIDLVEVDGLSERRRRESLATLRIRLTGRGLTDDASESDFRFLGMRGDVHVNLDPESRAPMLVSGSVGWLGRAKVRLERLILKGR